MQIRYIVVVSLGFTKIRSTNKGAFGSGFWFFGQINNWDKY